jgi:hypothetical protein
MVVLSFVRRMRLAVEAAGRMASGDLRQEIELRRDAAFRLKVYSSRGAQAV